MKYIDLHVHSTASDGTLTPDALALYAKDKGLTAMALTDHDTVSGIDTCLKAASKIGVTVIPGIEFSADFYGKELHILGFYIDHHDAALNQKLEELVTSRDARNEKMLTKLNELGIHITLADCLKDTSPNTIVTRAHIAKAMLEKGYISDRKEAFAKYIGDGGPAYIPKARFTAKECIDLIHQSKGLAVLAHPMLYGYGHKDLTNVFRGLVSDGLDGVECLYSTHTKEDTAYLLQICKQMNLLVTGGSDFHGKNKPNLDLGNGYGELAIPYTLLDAMKERLK